MEYGLRDVDGSGMQSLCQGFYEYFSVLSRISFFREQLSYEISNIINNKISSDLKSDLFLSNQHSVSPFFPLQLPFRSATQATTEFLVSLYLCLFWVVKDARGEWILTTTTPHNSSHPLKPTHSLHYQAHHSNRSAKGTSSPCLQGLVFFFFLSSPRQNELLAQYHHTSSGHYPADLSGLLL